MAEDPAGARDGRGRRLLSVDVGVKNMGVCEVAWRAGAAELGRWETVALAGPDGGGPQGLVPAAVQAVRGLLPAGPPWDVVLIENQPCLKNPRMKTVQVAVHAFLAGMGVDVELVAARGKDSAADRLLPPETGAAPPGPPRLAYSRRKRRSVQAAEAWLSRNAPGDLGRLRAARKKDDMCDALLQALHYLDRAGEVPLRKM